MKKTTILILLAFFAFGQMAWAQSVSYVYRYWDVNSVVSETRNESDFIVLNGSNSNDEYTLTSDRWYVVSGSDVKYKRLIAPSGTAANLILCDGAKLTAQITINNGCCLNIYAQSGGTGQLVAKGYTIGLATYTITAGIGSSEEGGDMGTLVIHGGVINAEGYTETPSVGGGGSAGIGGSGKVVLFDKSVSNGGTVTIYGGTITAKGYYGAGIGGGCSAVQQSEYGGNGGRLTIYGGTVNAESHDRGAGIGGGNSKSGSESNLGAGGTIDIYGGIVTARSCRFGAGIGGGMNGNGGTVTIYGGTVSAFGGTDAAGIGSGEQKSGNRHGGSLTVYGGTVFADGTGWGAGIGGGEDSDGATVEIKGGSVTAWAGEDAGNKNGCAIGSEDGDNHRGTLQIGNAMMVHAGQTPTTTSLFPSATRVPACFYRPYAVIEVCNHEGATYTVNGTDANGTHTLHCTHCLHSPTHTHTFNENNVCTVCGVGASVSTVSVYMPVNNNGTYTYGAEPLWTADLVTGSSFELPAPQASYLPAGVRFVGWRIGSPSELHLTDPHVGENEELHLAGESYTVDGDVSLTSRFNTYDVFTTAGNWNEPSNWCWNQLPTGDKEIVIAKAATIPNGCIAQTGNSLTIDLEGSITIADGGQLIHTNTGVQATVEKSITGHDNNLGGGWNFIASPISTAVNPSTIGLITDDFGSDVTPETSTYDLYYYNEPNILWKNYRSATFNLNNGQGYLYASNNGTSLAFNGTLNASTADPTLAVTASAPRLTGFNLVGNPFARNLSISSLAMEVNGSYSHITAIYELNGSNVVVNQNPSDIAPCGGFFIQTTDAGTLHFNHTWPEGSNGNNNGDLKIEVSQAVATRGDATLLDRAYINFGEGTTVDKFTLNPDATKLYIPQGGNEYAIVSVGNGRDVARNVSTNEMPVNFKAAEDGTYTLTVNPENVEMGYLHLIDNLTGNDVDLLALRQAQGPASYTFTAKTTDYASRFKLVFSVKDASTDSASDETFAFISNGNIIITDGPSTGSGTYTLQVIDMTGHVVRSTDVARNVSTAGMTPGVYILRLISGNDVKTQKIVVE